MKPKHKWLILILMGIFLAIMYGYSEARAEKLTVKLVTHFDTVEGSIIKAALAVRLSKYGVRETSDSDCVIHIMYYLAKLDITCRDIKKPLRIMFIAGVFMDKDRVVNSFQGAFYWDKDHTEEGFDLLVQTLYTGILEVYSGAK
jgi:hypothetical protein